jgi:hypothetical protein
MDGIAQGLAHRPHVGTPPIGAAQQRARQGTGASPLAQPSAERHVALLADLSRQLQPWLDQHGPCPPHEAALLLDAALINRYLPQGPRLRHQLRLDGLALAAGARPPRCPRALVEPKAATIACRGQPCASKVTTMVTTSTEGRNR